ncbi:MAG: T9SS type A sorting domain-containing protein, partial [Ignavibacteriales bacterium]|nr:T9SS type A sorting domain-containing protein [Ignavibacteriales bacterium]
ESYSDHESFWRYGYDAALLIEYAWPWNSSSNYSRNFLYHTQNDTLGSLNMSQVVKVTQMTLATTAEMCRDRPVAVARAETAPERFRVAQNYPNPFNPTTTIEFELAEAADVRATIYNALGEVVEVLADAPFDAGVTRLRWNAADLPAGAYVYEIRATSRRTGATFREARKALLLK